MNLRAVRRVICALLLPAAAQAQAAELTSETLQELNVIHIDGPITSGDSDRFRSLELDPDKQTVVLLSSRGGSVAEALEIGELIRRKQYATAVPEDSVCASSCGLIWLAGVRRYVNENAKIGFHAAYVGRSDQASESGVANAMIGAYLTRLGLSYNAVAFLTSAPPREFQWLHPEKARELGITFTTIPSDGASETWAGHAASAAPRRNQAATPYVPPSGPTNAPPSTPDPTTPEQRASQFVDYYYNLWSRIGKDTTLFTQMYAETVKFYGPPTPRANVMKDKQKFAERWPVRRYVVRSGSEHIECNITCQITGIVDWDASSPERGERSLGTAKFSLEVSASNPIFVFAESGSVLEAHKEPLSPTASPESTPPSLPLAPSATLPVLANPSFNEGRQARLDYEKWFANLPDGDIKQGVMFWAANRSNKPQPSCVVKGQSPLWIEGCAEARSLLSTSDQRRLSDRDYRLGWNSL